MKRFRFSPLLFRRIHKWIGLILGLQFVLWTLSGSVMALLDMEKVGGHDMAATHAHPLPTDGAFVPPARFAGRGPVSGVTLRDLAGQPVYELQTANGLSLVSAIDGGPIAVNADVARTVATMMNEAPVRSIELIAKANLEAREHPGRMWRVNFADAEESSAYVSAETGRFLVMRGDTWRTWDFFCVKPILKRDIFRQHRNETPWLLLPRAESGMRPPCHRRRADQSAGGGGGMEVASGRCRGLLQL